MMKKIFYKFIKNIPNDIQEGILYISIEYKTAIHKCVCGCGNEVVTPISPKDWQLSYDGENISLYPSIGNWGFDCRSHYWITNSEIEWASKWTDMEIKNSRIKYGLNKKEYFKKKKFNCLFKLFKKK